MCQNGFDLLIGGPLQDALRLWFCQLIKMVGFTLNLSEQSTNIIFPFIVHVSLQEGSIVPSN